MHVNETASVRKFPVAGENGPRSGCRLSGETITDKLGGTIKLSVSNRDFSPNDFDLSHDIKHLMFLPANQKIFPTELELPGVHNPLNGIEANVPRGIGIHEYGIQIVPTEFVDLRGKRIEANQYSVTERQVFVGDALVGTVIANQFYQDFLGVLISYDFYPVS